jgi:hypothetical protein
MLAWMTVLACLAAQQDAVPNADRKSDEPLDVQQMFVPFDQIDKFRDPTISYQSMGYRAFLELLRSADAAWKSRRFVGPTAGTITGRVDVGERRVFGTSTWSFPKGHAGSVELRPWNLRVLAVREQGRSERPKWGLTTDGSLRSSMDDSGPNSQMCVLENQVRLSGRLGSLGDRLVRRRRSFQ